MEVQIIKVRLYQRIRLFEREQAKAVKNRRRLQEMIRALEVKRGIEESGDFSERVLEIDCVVSER